MTGRVLFFFVFICATLFACAPPARAQKSGAARGWVGVRTPHFLVIGETREKDVRRAAERLELYRAAFARLLSPDYFDRDKATVVFLFGSESSYAPFRPVLDGRRATGVAGYFQPGTETDYITAHLDDRHDDATLLHEYAHLLLNNYFKRAPLWLKEGLAEYYSTARLSSDQRRLTLGAAPQARAASLKRRGLLSLRDLLAIDHGSDYYNDQHRRPLFYAQSWALVHYLSHDGGAAMVQRVKFERFLERLAAGTGVEEALREAFGKTTGDVERGLAAYVAAGRYEERIETLREVAASDAAVEARSLSRARLLAHLGDLLLQAGRLDEAEQHIAEAQSLDSADAEVNLRLGVLRLRQGRYDEAVALLRDASTQNPRDHYALFYLAEALDRDGLGMSAEDLSVSGFEEKTEQMRGLLRRAIELSPGFVEAYKLLALVEINRGGRPAEAAAIIERAINLAPRREDLPLVLALASLSSQDFNAARRQAEAIARGSADVLLRRQAELLLERTTAQETRLAEMRAAEESAARRMAEEVGPVQPCDIPEPGPYRKHLRFKGEQACGRLIEVECSDASVIFIVEAGGRVLRLRAESLNRVRLVTYTTEMRGQLTCGPRQAASAVLVTWRARRPDSTDTADGEALALEFIPADWQR